MRHLAEHDQLTGLYNRHALYQSQQDYQNNILVMLDIDFFKEVNDSYGHLVGDETLCTLAKKLEEVFSHRQNNLIYRLGGDEFLIVIKNTTEKDVIKKLNELVKPIPTDYGFNFTLSTGYTICNTNTFRDNLERADEALYYVKQHGRNNYYRG